MAASFRLMCWSLMIPRQELKAFVFLTVVMAPVLAELIVAGYGFAVWVYQMIAGPPGS